MHALKTKNKNKKKWKKKSEKGKYHYCQYANTRILLLCSGKEK